MCCWPFVQVELEEAPKPEEEKKEYVLVSDQLRLHPGVSRLFSFTSSFPPALTATSYSHITSLPLP